MPYIKKEQRIKFDSVFDKWPIVQTKGELEYCIYKMMLMYLANKTFCYSDLHDIVYAAIHCGDEFRRRYLDKREDRACQENGDITLS